MKKLVFIKLLIFVTLLLGCGTSTSKKTKDIDIFVGIEGLTAEFAKSAPPPRVFESMNFPSRFPILLSIRNKGAYSIAQDGLRGLLSIGSEKDYVPKIEFETNGKVLNGDKENEIYFFVDGKSNLNTKGEEIIVTAIAEAGKLDPQSEYRKTTITANLCYPYKTVLSATVCIDPDVGGIRPGKKVCNVKELVFNNGQGAPIAVTKIEPQMIPEGNNIKPQFLIFIENKGKGTPVDISNYVHACRQSDASKTNIWNVAFLNVYTSGKENQLDCTPGEASILKGTGFIRFRDKKDFVKCTFKKETREIKRTDDTYTSPLRIEIDYGYVQTVATTFTIQKPLKY